MSGLRRSYNLVFAGPNQALVPRYRKRRRPAFMNVHEPPLEPLDSSEEVVTHTWKPLREVAKYSAAALIMVVAFFLLRRKLAHLDWDAFVAGVRNISPV